MKRFLPLLLLAGCISAPQQTATTQAAQTAAIANGQLFCQLTTAAGPAVVAAATIAGAPVIATNAAASTVAAVCAAINAIPVAPPAVPSSVPIVATPVVSAPVNVSPTMTGPITITTPQGTFTLTPVSK